MSHSSRSGQRHARWRTVMFLGLIATLSLACGTLPGGEPVTTPPVSPGSTDAPREVNLITRDYSFVPDAFDLVPGETILLHVVNGGLVVHEAIVGPAAVQDAWEAAEAAVAGAPPGPTPVVTVPEEVRGVRVVVASGERVDLVWTVPADASGTDAWFVGCHIPGHWDKGMQIPVRWVTGTDTGTRTRARVLPGQGERPNDRALRVPDGTLLLRLARGARRTESRGGRA